MLTRRVQALGAPQKLHFARPRVPTAEADALGGIRSGLCVRKGDRSTCLHGLPRSAPHDLQDTSEPDFAFRAPLSSRIPVSLPQNVMYGD